MKGFDFQLNGDIRHALTIAIDQSFPLIPIPQPGDWLYEQEESGQTVDEFQSCRKAKPTRSFVVLRFDSILHFFLQMQSNQYSTFG